MREYIVKNKGYSNSIRLEIFSSFSMFCFCNTLIYFQYNKITNCISYNSVNYPL